ncbi:Uma2 family endonuclease [Sphingomonas sp.]|uniref:Uma2 family endonuclease n=1 Tax=Sphingomonas sp. TaxID=28214 RepID=UPI0035BBDAB3
MASIALDTAYRRVSVEEFLAMDFGGAKAELEDGIIFMMAGGTPEHAVVAARLIRRLGNALDGSGCEPVGSDMGVRTADRTLRYPDVSIYCGPVSSPDDPERTDPVVVIEVLSPSTAEHDQKVKLIEYQALPGVREILFVDPITGAIRTVRRTDDGGWSDRWLRGDEGVEVVHFGVSLSRSEIGVPS